MKIKNLSRRQQVVEEEKLTLGKLVQYRYEHAKMYQDFEDDLEGEMRGLNIKQGKSEEYLPSDSIKAEFVPDNNSAKQIVREQFLKEVGKYGFTQKLVGTKNTVQFLAPDYETCSRDNFVCPDKIGKQNDTQKMDSPRSTSEHKWSILQHNIGKVTLEGEIAFLQDRRQVFKLKILFLQEYSYEHRDLCLTEPTYYPSYDEDAQMYEIPILDDYIIGPYEYAAFWPLHPDLRECYAELLTLKKVHQVYDSIIDRVNLTFSDIQKDFGVELGVLLFKYLRAEEMRNIQRKDLRKENTLNIIHENMHKEKKKLIITIINKVKNRRKLSQWFNHLYQSDDEYNLGKLVRPEFVRLADYMLMDQVPIFNIERQPLIWIYYQRGRGVLIPIRYFIETEQFSDVFENAEDQFEWRCCDVLCNRLEYAMGSNFFKAYVKVFIYLRLYWKGLINAFEEGQREYRKREIQEEKQREAERFREEEKKKQQDAERSLRERLKDKKFVIQQQKQQDDQVKEEAEKGEEKKTWLGRWTASLKSKLPTFKF